MTKKDLVPLSHRFETPAAFVADMHLKPVFASRMQDVVGDVECGLDQITIKCFEHDIKTLILGGDVFDVNYFKHMWLGRLFSHWVSSMRDHGITVIAYPGNHDFVYYQQPGDDKPTHMHELAGVLDVDGQYIMIGDRLCYVMGHRDTPTEFRDELCRVRHKPDTLFLHQLIKPWGDYDLNVVPDHFQAIFIGDLHEHQEGTNTHGAWWGYPSCMFAQNINQDEHGMFILSGTPGERGRWIPYPGRRVKWVALTDPMQTSTVIKEVREWSDAVRAEWDEIDPDTRFSAVHCPVVEFRVTSDITTADRAAISSELEGWVHLRYKQVKDAESTNVSAADVQSLDVPPLDRMVDIMRSKLDDKVVEKFCPHYDESADLLKDLLASGPTGQKAGDDDARPDGSPLAWRSIIRQHLLRVSEKHDLHTNAS